MCVLLVDLDSFLFSSFFYFSPLRILRYIIELETSVMVFDFQTLYTLVIVIMVSQGKVGHRKIGTDMGKMGH